MKKTKLNKDISLYLHFKAVSDAAIMPLLILLKRMGIKSDQVTFFRLILVFLAVLLVKVNFWMSVFLFIFNFILDAVDGGLARLLKTSSSKGKFLDRAADNLVFVILILTLIYYGYISGFWACIYLLMYGIQYSIVIRSIKVSDQNFPFFYSKLWLYAAILLWLFLDVFLIDIVLVALSFYLLIINSEKIWKIYNKME